MKISISNVLLNTQQHTRAFAQQTNTQQLAQTETTRTSESDENNGNRTSLTFNSLFNAARQTTSLQQIASQSLASVKTDDDNKITLLEKMDFISQIAQRMDFGSLQIQQIAELEFANDTGTNFETAGLIQDTEEPMSFRQATVTQRSQLIEESAMTFEAFGSVTTEDGRTIDFLLQLDYRHETTIEQNQTLQTTSQLIDPLVINLNGGAPKLSDTLFEFDLNGDGETEMIHQLASGTGFLVFDRNHNNIIDNGLEMFGPASGQGFNELSAYDEDGNGWLDENDSAFYELGILQFGVSGEQIITSLKDANIGALYLGAENGQFDLRDSNGQFQAQIQRSGFALTEDGLALSLQEIYYPDETNNDSGEFNIDAQISILQSDAHAWLNRLDGEAVTSDLTVDFLTEFDLIQKAAEHREAVQDQMRSMLNDESLFKDVAIGIHESGTIHEQLSDYERADTRISLEQFSYTDSSVERLRKTIEELKDIKEAQDKPQKSLSTYKEIGELEEDI